MLVLKKIGPLPGVDVLQMPELQIHMPLPIGGFRYHTPILLNRASVARPP
jgi:hypothetical protein